MTITEDLHMLLYVALGGALGSVGRYLVAGSLKGVGGTDFPWHMIAVNTLGCILVGFFVAVLYVKLPHPRWINLFYWGFIGGFTAFSSFIKEGMQFFPAWGAYYGIPLYFPAEHAWYVCCRCRFLVGQDAALRMTAAPL